MSQLALLTARYWKASMHLRGRHRDPDLADWESWGVLAGLRNRVAYPRLCQAAQDFLFPRRPPASGTRIELLNSRETDELKY